MATVAEKLRHLCEEEMDRGYDNTRYKDLVDQQGDSNPFRGHGVGGLGRVLFTGETPNDAYHQLIVDQEYEKDCTPEYDDSPVIKPGVNPNTVPNREVSKTRTFDRLKVGFDEIPGAVETETGEEEEQRGQDNLEFLIGVLNSLGSPAGLRRDLPSVEATQVPW